MTKTALSERDICTKFITPALVAAGWDLISQIREEVTFTAGLTLAQATGMDAGFWLGLQLDWDLWHELHSPAAQEIEKIERLQELAV